MPLGPVTPSVFSSGVPENDALGPVPFQIQDAFVALVNPVGPIPAGVFFEQHTPQANALGPIPAGVFFEQQTPQANALGPIPHGGIFGEGSGDVLPVQIVTDQAYIQVNRTILTPLAQVELDLRAAGGYDLWTCPVGFIGLVVGLHVVGTNVSGVVTEPDISLQVATPGDLITTTPLTGLNANGETFSFSLVGLLVNVPAGQVVRVVVDAPADATNYIARIALYGIASP